MGRVMLDGSKALGDAYHIVIEKVFLCSGANGYIPVFIPQEKKYGCLADSPNLTHRFKILVCHISSVFMCVYLWSVASTKKY